MVATGGFGAFPDNPLTQTFQEVIGENIPADFLNPFNTYMEDLSVPTIQPLAGSDNDASFDPVGTLAALSKDGPPTAKLPDESEIIETAVASILETVTELVPTSTATSTITLTSTSTLTSTATNTSTASATFTVTATQTRTPVYIPPTRTRKPKPATSQTPGTSIPPTANPCLISSNYSISGEYWHLGNTSCSCDDVCNGLGGVNLVVFNTVGDDADGGTNTKCNDVLTLFFGAGTTVDWAPIGAYVGCHLDINGYWRARYIGESSLPSASAGNIQRVCACNN